MGFTEYLVAYYQALLVTTEICVVVSLPVICYWKYVGVNLASCSTCAEEKEYNSIVHLNTSSVTS